MGIREEVRLNPPENWYANYLRANRIILNFLVFERDFKKRFGGFPTNILDKIIQRAAVNRIETLLNMPDKKLGIISFIQQNSFLNNTVETEKAKIIAGIFYTGDKEVFELASRFGFDFMKTAESLSCDITQEQRADVQSLE